MLRRIMSVLLVAAIVSVATACGNDDEDKGDGGGATVKVQLQEFSVIPDVTSATAGKITFVVSNAGPDDEHEFVVLRTDLAPTALPTKDDGSVDEDQLEAVDEVEDLAVGQSAQLSLDLAAGKYVFICNIVEEKDGETEAHYVLGMRAAFTVN